MSSQFNDNDDDLPLTPRRAGTGSHPLEDRRAEEIAAPHTAEREVTLNTGIVLALFFALALLCAVFFGFGYSIGHKSAPVAAAAEPDSVTPSENSATPSAGAKPAPGLPAAQPVPEYVPSTGTPAKPAAAVASVAAARTPDAVVVSESVPAKPPAERTPASAAAAPSVPAAAPAGGPGSSYVQIAAVSHQEDADVLLSALRRRGYAVLTRSDAADKLIHVQVGPFGSRKEAEAMRQKLAGDGYNAFIK